jgi:hypothetical protein
VNAKIIAAAVLLILAVLSGYWVSGTGRPLNTVIFTVHKLLALAGVVFAVLAAVQLQKGFDLKTVIIILMAASGIFAAALFATGAILSFEKPAHDAVHLIHSITPYLIAVSLAAMFWLLLKK